jgi:DNA repair protein SbcC/Rad50
MINIHKIYIKNFKGIHDPHIVDFSTASLTILDGPNGFGKTTIFDTIEICLRGKLERTVSYDHVTKKNADHKKPFYQNTKGEDVILKLWLHDDVSNTDHLIIKYLDKGHDGKVGTSKAFRPDSWSILVTYYANNIENFENEDDLTGYEEINWVFRGS